MSKQMFSKMCIYKCGECTVSDPSSVLTAVISAGEPRNEGLYAFQDNLTLFFEIAALQNNLYNPRVLLRHCTSGTAVSKPTAVCNFVSQNLERRAGRTIPVRNCS